MSQYNDGPWESIPSLNGKSIAVYGPTIRGCREEIARCCSWHRAENAPLIAAAPELLKACEAARRAMVNGQTGNPWIGMAEACELIDAAIAKAKGGSA